MHYEVMDNSGARISYDVVEGILPRDTVFIHGNMASNRWWTPAEQVWREKAQGTLPGSMILVEFRGCGQSSDPRSQEDVDMKLFAHDFISLIRSLNRGPVNLVGHSTGGLIAALMLAKAPELFHKAVLLDPVGARGVVFQESMTAAFEQMKKDRNLVAVVLGSTIHENDASSEYFQKVIVEDAFRAAKSVGDRVLRALDRLDVREELSTVNHPVLVLHGEHDLLLPREDSEELAGLMKNAQFSIILEQGHCANIENPKRFVEVVQQFLF